MGALSTGTHWSPCYVARSGSWWKFSDSCYIYYFLVQSYVDQFFNSFCLFHENLRIFITALWYTLKSRARTQLPCSGVGCLVLLHGFFHCFDSPNEGKWKLNWCIFEKALHQRHRYTFFIFSGSSATVVNFDSWRSKRTPSPPSLNLVRLSFTVGGVACSWFLR